MKRILYFFLLILLLPKIVVLTSGCAQVIAPTGGARDTIPPRLINANPKSGTTYFKGNRITLTFDEYVQLQELQQNLLVSPTPKRTPYVNYNLKTVTIKLYDTLEPNTTYSIDLGNSIRDINENNAIKNFVYVFSTGATLDSLNLSGKVQLAETGQVDSTLIVLLYKNLSDTAVLKLKPKFIARLDREGRFNFHNLSGGEYKIYALSGNNFTRTYNNKSDLFAFADSPVVVNSNSKPVSLYAYVEQKEIPKTSQAKSAEKKLKFTTKIPVERQDLLSDLVLDFNRPLKNFDKQKLLLTDTLNNIIKGYAVSIDSTNKRVSINNKWQEDADYKLIILKDFATDSSGVSLPNTDTIRFKTKREVDYATLKLHFTNFDKTKNPVLQFVVNNVVVNSYPLTSENWTAQLFNPGEYEIRILFDENKNGKWDPGNFSLKKQPEKVFAFPQKISLRENFEKEIDNIELPK